MVHMVRDETRFRMALFMLPFSRHHTGMMLPENLKDTEMSGELTPIHWELPKGPAVPLLCTQEATEEYLVSHEAVFLYEHPFYSEVIAFIKHKRLHGKEFHQCSPNKKLVQMRD